MDDLGPRVILTTQIGRAPNGVKRHVLIRDDELTACGRVTTWDWFFGEERPPTSTLRTYWCARCFPDTFTIVSGRRMALDPEVDSE